jgi:hypothetical protein
MAFNDKTILASDITPKSVFENRRSLIKTAAAGSFGAALAPWFSRQALAATPEKLAATLNPAYDLKEEPINTSPRITIFMNLVRINRILPLMLAVCKSVPGQSPLRDS